MHVVWNPFLNAFANVHETAEWMSFVLLEIHSPR